ncbi:cytochrome c oxidase subunit 3 [Humisphaera borealis]|uniref:Cytochrome c oxidase subunit 3 n=1 Tax=Humisphaera borealis TaxID=2807512 RepID=A0A7M2X0X4_9BACT|nr:cytochrome c oxidase subunit 3 [Humisphaera borealis]QOV91319.1 cytochrome c oxidase subunit 3 [Humisphaera borealis]
MSEYAVQFVAEEHAPDPVHSRGDPTLPGKIGIWLFLASEIMFFVAILGSYIVYRSGAAPLFEKNAQTLSIPMAAVNTVVLIFSSLTMALAVDASQKGSPGKAARYLAITLLCAFGFLGIKFFEYKSKFEHFTFQYRVSDTQVDVYDAHVHKGEKEWEITHAYKMPLPDSKAKFDMNQVVLTDIKAAGQPVPDGKIDPANVTNILNYGPSRNIFFSSYFTLTGIHGLHVIGGIIPLFFLLVHALRGKVFPRHTEYTGLYWHFVDLVWIFLFPLLYLI